MKMTNKTSDWLIITMCKCAVIRKNVKVGCKHNEESGWKNENLSEPLSVSCCCYTAKPYLIYFFKITLS